MVVIATIYFLLLTGLKAEPAIAELNSNAVTQNINNLIKPSSLPDVMGQQVQAFDAQVAKANQEVKDAEEADRRAAQEAQPMAVVLPQYSGTCADWMAEAGISDPADAYQIIMRESGCNPCSINPGYSNCELTASQIGTACGIGQQLPCGKWPHAWNDPVGGLIDMQNYVYARYGSWANAWYYWQVHGNY